MRGSFIFFSLVFCLGRAYANTELTAAIENVREVCGGISDELSDLKKMAGINTAVTSVGTVAGGVALGTGIAKAGVDKELAQKESEIDKLMKNAGFVKLETEDELLEVLGGMFGQTQTEIGKQIADSIAVRRDEISKLEQKSKNLGNWRTGMMATATAANIAGAVIGGNNRVKGDLKTQINGCLTSVKTLSNVRMQARMTGDVSEAQLARAENIVSACEEWSMVDIGSINKKASGATISSGIGAGLGLAGTVTSAMANTDDVRSDNTASGKNKEKTLNTASNILAGGTTVASATATVFNATQIGAIKRAVETAEKCEGALR